MTTRKLALMLALAASAALQQSRAYFDVNTDWSWHIRSDLTQRAANESYRLAHQNQRSSQAAKTEARKPDPKGYEYQYSPAVSNKVTADYLNALIQEAQRSGQLTPEKEAQLRSMGQWNVVESLRNRIRDNGFNPDSVAQAMAFWLQINYLTIVEATGSDIPTNHLLTQLQNAMGHDPAMIAMSDADKQEIAEQLLWMAFIQILVREDAQGDPAKMQQAAQHARDALNGMGIDPDKMQFTQDGLVIY